MLVCRTLYGLVVFFGRPKKSCGDPASEDRERRSALIPRRDRLKPPYRPAKGRSERVALWWKTRSFQSLLGKKGSQRSRQNQRTVRVLVHGVAGRQRACSAVESQRLQHARKLALVNRFPNRSHSAIERNLGYCRCLVCVLLCEPAAWRRVNHRRSNFKKSTKICKDDIRKQIKAH